MARLFTIPTEPLARFRAAAIAFATIVAILNAVVFAFESHLGAPTQFGAALAATLLAAWWIFGYRTGGFPVAGWLPEIALIAIVSSVSPTPFHGLAVFYVGMQLRALYASRRELVFLCFAYAAARILSSALTPAEVSRWELFGTVCFQTFGLTAVAVTLKLFVEATERHEASERALKRSDERYHLVAQAMRDVVYDWNVGTGAIEWTASMQTVFGYTSESVGTSISWWWELVHPADREEVERTIARALANTDVSVESIRHRVRCADGRYAFIAGSLIVQRAPSGAAKRVIGSLRDVTAEQQLQERLRQSQKMEAIGQLAGGVAHDFNNLLTVIGGHVFMLEHALGSSPVLDKHLGGISRAADRAAALTRQLLAFSRKQLLAPSILDLNEVVEDVVLMMRPALGEHIRLVTKLDPLLSPVFADAGQLGQVLVNLALNARDAMSTGGTLTIETANTRVEAANPDATAASLPDGEYVRLVVRDTGAGMDAPTLARAFEPFFTTKAQGQGTGLGLATVYGIIKQSFGDIQATSVPGKGSVFAILLPVAHRPAELPAPVAASSNGYTPRLGRQRTVLLVEDDDGVREFAREVLSRAGYQVHTARNGVEGISVARAQPEPVGLVVSDVVMPEMGGRQMVEQLRRTWPTLPVLFITGYTDDSGMLDQLRETDARLLEKPFTAAAFITMVDELGAPAATIVDAPAAALTD